MIHQIDIALHPAIHDIINLHIYPEVGYRLGQSERFDFAGADIVLERIGNAFAQPRSAISYRYCIDGPGFVALLHAVWHDDDDATADVDLIAIRPDDDESSEAIKVWLASALTARLPPRDLFGLTPVSA